MKTMSVDVTSKKIKELLDSKKPMGCLSCGDRVDDGMHEYNDKQDIWYCPALDEE